MDLLNSVMHEPIFLILLSGAFWLYSGITFLGMIFMVILLPETRGKTLEEVQDLFRGAKVNHETEHPEEKGFLSETDVDIPAVV
jgi:hypothetical protein